jgi:hypothetical protein
MDISGESHIMSAQAQTAEEALTLLAEPAVAVLFDLDDVTVEEGRVVCTSDGRTVVCHIPRDFVSVRMTLGSVRASRIDPVVTSVRRGADGSPEAVP